jgi:hypothetical protein
MKNILLGLALATLCAVSLAAQTLTSVQVMPLTLSQQFQNRIVFQIVLAAPVIETESAAYTQPGGDNHPVSAACHSKRAFLAAAVSQNPWGYALVFAVHVVTTGNVTTKGALIGQGATYDTPALDADLFSAVNAVWSDTAGCVTVP